MKFLYMIFVAIFISGSFAFSQEEQKEENSYPKFIPYVHEVNNLQANTVNMDIKDYGNEQPARWLSVDPMANKYPGWSPYNYTLNNLLRFIDPNGMWSGEYDKDKNTVSVRYEKGDTYEGLYKQLGMSAEDFANKYKVDLNKDISSDASFDITDKVLKQTDFSKDKSMMNCFSSSIYGTGALSEETPVQGGFNFTQDAQKVLGYEEVTQPQPGSIVTWEDNSGITNHAAIYVIKGNDGTSYYFGRPGPNSDVSIQSSKNTSTLYPNFKETFLRYSLSKPKF